MESGSAGVAEYPRQCCKPTHCNGREPQQQSVLVDVESVFDSGVERSAGSEVSVEVAGSCQRMSKLRWIRPAETVTFNPMIVAEERAMWLSGNGAENANKTRSGWSTGHGSAKSGEFCCKCRVLRCAESDSFEGTCVLECEGYGSGLAVEVIQ